MRTMAMILTAAVLAAVPAQAAGGGEWPRDGSPTKPLEVMLVPADGGTEEGTKKDFMPLFNAITKAKGIHFNLRAGQSYGAVVEAMANEQVDIAFFGAVSYLQCKKRGGAELLAVSVEGGSSTYYAGIFVRADSNITSLEGLKGRSVAVGDPSSTSSFTYPLAMIMDAGVDPVKDLSKLVMAGSHVNSLMACAEGHVDAACASFTSLEKGINEKKIPAGKLKPLVKSDPIPNPPLALQPKVPADLKAKIREAFATIHQAPGVTPDMIRGYGGKKADRYDTTIADSEMDKAGDKLARLDKIKDELLKKASQK